MMVSGRFFRFTWLRGINSFNKEASVMRFPTNDQGCCNEYKYRNSI